MSEDKAKSIYSRISEVQWSLRVPKNQKNTFGKYNYRSCEDITEAVKPLLHKNGLSLIISDSIETIGDRVYVVATATLFDDKGESVKASGHAREAVTKKGMDDAQITGAASSYARKYALCGLFAIDDNKDMDTDEYQRESSSSNGKPKNNPTPSTTETSIDNMFQDKMREVRDLCDQHGWNDTHLMRWVHDCTGKSFRDMTLQELDTAIESIKTKYEPQTVEVA